VNFSREIRSELKLIQRLIRHWYRNSCNGFYAGKTDYEISKRIEKLDNEWDIGRCIEGRAAIVSFIGVILGLKKSKKWLILSIIALTFLLQYAILGWCSPVALLRRFGIRMRQEIYLEKYALQVLCRDFHDGKHIEGHHGKHHHGKHHNEYPGEYHMYWVINEFFNGTFHAQFLW